MTSTRPRRWLLLVATVLFPCSAFAQCIDRPLPTSFSTRALAMGDAGLASRDDDVIFYGPAQLVVARGTSIAGEGYPDKLASGTVATTTRLASGGVGIGAQVMEGRDLGTCAGLPAAEAPAQTLTRSLGVVGGALPFRKFRLGIAAKYAAEQADAARRSALLMDAGVARDFTLADFIPVTAALAIQNIGPAPTDAIELGVPRRVALGLSSGGPVGPVDLAVALEGGLEHTGTTSFGIRNRPLARGGIEVGYSWLDGYSVALRAGARTAAGYEQARHLTAGAGLEIDRLSIDYAIEDLTGTGFGHRLGIRLR